MTLAQAIQKDGNTHSYKKEPEEQEIVNSSHFRHEGKVLTTSNPFTGLVQSTIFSATLLDETMQGFPTASATEKFVQAIRSIGNSLDKNVRNDKIAFPLRQWLTHMGRDRRDADNAPCIGDEWTAMSNEDFIRYLTSCQAHSAENSVISSATNIAPTDKVLNDIGQTNLVLSHKNIGTYSTSTMAAYWHL